MTTLHSMDVLPYGHNPRPTYPRPPKVQAEDDNAVIQRAMQILLKGLKEREVFSMPTAVKQYLQLRFSPLDHEVFSVMFLTAHHHLIECVDMFRGTLTQTSVYPREVVKEALRLNAAAVVFCHNHPSGSAEPSRADEALTQTLKSALALVDVRVVDHIVVCRDWACSMAERGLM